MLLLIDNYDSFVFNLARYFQRLGQEIHVVRNDAVDVAAVRRMRPSALVLSPGPCGPNEAGCSLELVRELHAETPILGVCLGHQTIGAAFGGRIVRASRPMHGRASQIEHDGRELFENLPQPMPVGRYHSLVVQPATLPDCLEVTAQTASGAIMALRHRGYPVWGVQFHPESVLTEGGHQLLANFLRLAGMTCSASIPTLGSELLAPIAATRALPTRPVTF